MAEPRRFFMRAHRRAGLPRPATSTSAQVTTSLSETPACRTSFPLTMLACSSRASQEIVFGVPVKDGLKLRLVTNPQVGSNIFINSAAEILPESEYSTRVRESGKFRKTTAAVWMCTSGSEASDGRVEAASAW